MICVVKARLDSGSAFWCAPVPQEGGQVEALGEIGIVGYFDSGYSLRRIFNTW